MGLKDFFNKLTGKTKEIVEDACYNYMLSKGKELGLQIDTKL